MKRPYATLTGEWCSEKPRKLPTVSRLWSAIASFSRDLDKAIGQSPEAPGVYFIKHRETGEIYIGGTKNIRYRLRQHWTRQNNGRSGVIIGKSWPSDIDVSWIVDNNAFEREAEILDFAKACPKLVNAVL